MVETKLDAGRVYWVKWRARDIGYGIERGSDEYIYRGGPDTWGKYEFQPVGGGETVYLFGDEIIYCEDDGS